MKTKSGCYNCKFAGEQFKIKELTHLHCEDPIKYTQEKHDNDEFCAWDTLRVFSDICSNHELAEPKQLIIGDVSKRSEMLLSAICQFTKRNTQKEIQEVEKWIETNYRN